MSARAARAALHARAAMAARAGVPTGHAARTRHRIGGEGNFRASLEELLHWPLWPGEEACARARIFALTALVAARDSFANIIDGAVFRSYAAPVGEAALDAVLALPSGGSAPLGSADALVARGRMLAQAALPPALAQALDISPPPTPEHRATVALAERIARSTAP